MLYSGCMHGACRHHTHTVCCLRRALSLCYRCRALYGRRATARDWQWEIYSGGEMSVMLILIILYVLAWSLRLRAGLVDAGLPDRLSLALTVAEDDSRADARTGVLLLGEEACRL